MNSSQNTMTLDIAKLSRTPQKRSWASKVGLVLFLMTIPTVLYVFIFHYLPLGGLVIAFKDYSSFKGIMDSPWTSMAGFKHFHTFINSPNFWLIMKNTLVLSVASIIFNSFNHPLTIRLCYYLDFLLCVQRFIYLTFPNLQESLFIRFENTWARF